MNILTWVRRIVDRQTRSVIQRIVAMQAHSNALSQPSEFWNDLNHQHIEMLRRRGIRNFKRTLAQCYFTFAVESTRDPQMAALIEHWATDPSPDPLSVRIIGDPQVESQMGLRYLRDCAAARSYELFLGLLLWHSSKTDPEGLSSRLAEPAIGNPIPARSGNRLVSQDLANSIREYGRFRDHLGPGGILAEIGAGYGRLGYVAANRPAKYWIFDIAPALAVSEWYLPRALPGCSVFKWRPFEQWSEVRGEADRADLAFFSSDQLALIPDRSVDVFAAISCLHEMTGAQAQKLLHLMGQKASRAIYTKNHTSWMNEKDGIAFRSDALAAPKGWTIRFDRPDDVLKSFTEKLMIPAESDDATHNA